MKKIPTLTMLAVLMALTACAHKVEPQSSEIETPTLWSRLTSFMTDKKIDAPLALSDKAEVEQTWWKNFADPVLNALIDEALLNNKTLQIAKARVEEAQAGSLKAFSPLLPELNGTGTANRQNQGFLSNNDPYSIREADLQASWELDLFGRNQARLYQARAIEDSEEANHQGVMVSLLAEVARNYFSLRNYEAQIAITQRNLETQKQTLDLIKAQQEGALTSDLDVQRASAQVSTTAAQIPALRAAYDTYLNHLNVLLGYPPGIKDQLFKTRQDLKPLNARIMVSAPVKVLANRPDVRAAERAFAASISASDAAEREIFPTISLLGFFGIQDSSRFSVTPWQLSANVAQPLLNFGRIQSDIDAADARQKQAFLRYKEAVLEALEDMENALSSYLHETVRHHDLELAAQQNRKSVELAQQQYLAGYTGLLDVLVAQRNELESESSLASSDADLRKNLVHIYTAAGGGWKLTQPHN